MQKSTTIIGVIVLLVIAFFVGRLTVKPLDGNPVGYHLHGLAKLDQQQVSLASCSNKNPCNMSFDIYFNATSAPANTASCGASTSCFSFHNLPTDGLKSQMTVTIDEGSSASSGYSGTVYAQGAVTGS
jgi:hypothetical protein